VATAVVIKALIAATMGVVIAAGEALMAIGVLGAIGHPGSSLQFHQNCLLPLRRNTTLLRSC